MRQWLEYGIVACIAVLALTSGRAAGQYPRRHSFEVGPELYYFYYEERDASGYFEDDEKMMSEDGLFYGLAGAYTYRGWAPSADGDVTESTEGLMFRAEGRFAVGQVDYDGQTQDGEPLTVSDIDDRTMELRPLIGLGFSNADFEGFLYTGFGYRYLNDDLSEFPGGYERESNYYYIPIGLTGTGTQSDGWTLGGTLELDILVRGVQKSHLSDAGGGWPDVENDQTSGWGLRGALRFEHRANVDLVIEPFVRLWAIDKSDEVPIGGGYYAYEPENYTVEGGLHVLIQF